MWVSLISSTFSKPAAASSLTSSTERLEKTIEVLQRDLNAYKTSHELSVKRVEELKEEITKDIFKKLDETMKRDIQKDIKTLREEIERLEKKAKP